MEKMAPRTGTAEPLKDRSAPDNLLILNRFSSHVMIVISTSPEPLPKSGLK
jgi:hypothetical protein